MNGICVPVATIRREMQIRHAAFSSLTPGDKIDKIDKMNRNNVIQAKSGIFEKVTKWDKMDKMKKQAKDGGEIN